MSSDFTKFAGPYGGPLLLTLCVLLACVFEPASGEWLAYDRYAIEGFETWRLLTANIVHTNGWHALLNLAGLTCSHFCIATIIVSCGLLNYFSGAVY